MRAARPDESPDHDLARVGVRRFVGSLAQARLAGEMKSTTPVPSVPKPGVSER